MDPQVAVAYAGKLGLTNSIQPVIYESILFPYHDQHCTLTILAN